MTHKRNITKNIRTTRNKRTTVSWVRDSPRLFVEDPERERIRKKTTVRERKRKMTTKKRTRKRMKLKKENQNLDN